MARRRASLPLNVFANGRLVGTMRRESSGATDFRYDRDWIDWGNAFPVSLSMPLREDRYIGEPVVNVFDNLLPDSAAIRKRVAERVGAGGVDPFSLLSAIGHDCIGALQFLPDGVDPGVAGIVDGQPIDDEAIAELLRNLASAPLGMGEDDDFRISIAGAQEKTALLRKEGQWFRPRGTTATTHILKPQIGRVPHGIDLSDSVENEYLCLKLLRAFGVPAARAEMTAFGDRRTLVVERFDRLWTSDGRLLRLPQEDTCQALSVPPTRKYQSEGGPGIQAILELLNGADQPDVDRVLFMRANILFWLLGATDGHAKNFSVFLAPGGRFRMTPLYDVLSTQPNADAGEIPIRKFKLSMAVGKRAHYAVQDVMPRHFLETAALAGVGMPTMQTIFEDIAAGSEKRIDDVIAELPVDFPEPLISSIRPAVLRRAGLIGEALAAGLPARRR